MTEDELPLKISPLKIDPLVEIKSHQKGFKTCKKNSCNSVQTLSQLKFDAYGAKNQSLSPQDNEKESCRLSLS